MSRLLFNTDVIFTHTTMLLTVNLLTIFSYFTKDLLFPSFCHLRLETIMTKIWMMLLYPFIQFTSVLLPPASSICLKQQKILLYYNIHKVLFRKQDFPEVKAGIESRNICFGEITVQLSLNTFCSCCIQQKPGANVALM